MAEALRVIDFGTCSPLRSQTLWHAVAYGVSAGAPATLSFTRPAAPYVCLGFHRAPDEVDHGYCRAQQLPVSRRMVGGGPVYLDADQLFFQISVPARAVPALRALALRRLLEPAVAAFSAVGVPAVLDDDLEIGAGERKICGHGAGQVEDAVVVCGNLIERFDHERATGVLALAEPAQRDQTLALMRRFVAATPVDAVCFQAAMVDAYSAAFGLAPVAGELDRTERAALDDLDDRFCTSEWLAGPGGHGSVAAAGQPRRVKVRAGVLDFAAHHDGAHVVASVVRGTLEEVSVRADGLNGLAPEAERALRGAPLSSVTDVLARFGEPGQRLAAAFATAGPGPV